jgi:hypothetical protein
MPWYDIGIRPGNVDRGEDRLVRMVQAIWESSGKPDGFALLGKHRTVDGKFTVYYLTPGCQKPINQNGGGFFTFWQVVPTVTIPSRESLQVLVGDRETLTMLD